MQSQRAPWWMYVLAASFVANLALDVYTRSRGPFVPFDLVFSGNLAIVANISVTGKDEFTPILPGDHITAVNGIPLRGSADWDLIALTLVPMQPTPVPKKHGGNSI